MNNERTNPCYGESLISMQCLDDNNYDREKCEKEFENYRNCKKFWGSVESHRRRKGIVPAMPTLEERIKIKAEHLAK